MALRGAIVAVVLVLAGGSGTVLAATAESHQRDAAATLAYLAALHGAELAARKDRAAGQAEAQALIGRVRRQCPDVLARASPTAPLLSKEVDLDVDYAHVAPARPAFDAFSRTIEKLRWTSLSLTRYVHRLGEALTAYEDIVVPDICADAKTLVADGFHTVAPETERFIKQQDAAEEELFINEPGHSSVQLSVRVQQLLARYENAADRRLLPRNPTKTEARADEKATFSQIEELRGALGLSEQ